MKLTNWADDALDFLVIPSFSRIGPFIRRRVFDWENVDLTNKHVAITGPTSGIGLAVAQKMATQNARLTLMARNPDKAQNVQTRLAELGNHQPTIIQCDLANLNSVRSAGNELATLGPLDCLIHNGGGLHSERLLSDDNIELTLATHVVAPFVLTGAATNALTQSQGRIITVSSGGMYSQRIRLDDVQTVENYSGAKAYARAKRAQLVLNQLWAKRLKEQNISVHTMHPGWVDTPGIQQSLSAFSKLMKPLLRTPAEGADTVIWLAGTTQPIESGRFWLDRRRRPTSYLPGTATTSEEADRLWTAVNNLTKNPLGKI